MRLIINGDDFGFTRGINLGICDCFQRGIMNSTSLMVNMKFAEEAAEMIKNPDGLSVGLHFNVTVGEPVSHELKRIITPEGHFSKELLRKDGADIYEELWKEGVAQIEHFVHLTGRLPSHINSHHGIEVTEAGREVIQDLGLKYDIPIRAFIMDSCSLTEKYRTDYEVPGCKLMEGVDFGMKSIEEYFSDSEIESDSCFELVGHPGYVDSYLPEMSGLTIQRCHDMRCFCSESWAEWLRNNPIQLIGYEDLRKIR